MSRLVPIGLWALVFVLPLSTSLGTPSFGPAVAYADDGSGGFTYVRDGSKGCAAGTYHGDPDDPQTRGKAVPWRRRSIMTTPGKGYGSAGFGRVSGETGMWRLRTFVTGLRYYYLRF